MYNLRLTLKRLLGTFAISIPAGITIIDVIGYVAKVEGSSMQPVLNPLDNKTYITDYVFLYNWPVATNSFEKFLRGDIVALVSPSDPKQRIIKRIIGLGGDVIETRGHPEPFAKIPPGHCWVEGDHHGHSLDSNVFGPVPLGLVKSQAKCIVWPPSRWRMLSSDISTLYGSAQKHSGVLVET